MRIRHPPGRSGRLWLQERFAVAERAAEILHHKQQALRHEEHRLAELAERTNADWEGAVRVAETWQRRAMVLGGRPALRNAVVAGARASAHFAWRTEMGVDFPGEARCELPEPPALPGTPALTEAADAYRQAVELAVATAAALTALDRVSAELRTTRRRLRAIRDRWMPSLTRALQELELALDEQEREELTRTHSHHRSEPSRSGPHPIGAPR